MLIFDKFNILNHCKFTIQNSENVFFQNNTESKTVTLQNKFYLYELKYD